MNETAKPAKPLDTIYTCSKCGHTEVRKHGGIYTANVPVCCGLVMIARKEEVKCNS